MAQEFTVNRRLTSTDVAEDGALESSGASAQNEARSLALELGVAEPVIGDPEQTELPDGGVLVTVRFSA